jgi:hypothetical protein
MLTFFLMRSSSKQQRLNPVDEAWTKHVCLPFHNYILNRTKCEPSALSECCFSALVVLSDQQLVVSLALLIAGIVMFVQRRISVYHWTTVADMAWLGSGTQLASLTVTTEWLRTTNQRRRRYLWLPLLSTWRVICMAATCILLMVVVWLEGFKDWYGSYKKLAHCISWSPAGWGDEDEFWTISSLLIVPAAYSMALGSLILSARGVRLSFRPQIEVWEARVTGRLGRNSAWLRVYAPGRWITLGLWYLLRSEPFILLYELAWFSAGLYYIINDRTYGHNLMLPEDIDDENAISFGQLVPLLLLMLPFMAFIETYHSKLPCIVRSLGPNPCDQNSASKLGCHIVTKRTIIRGHQGEKQARDPASALHCNHLSLLWTSHQAHHCACPWGVARLFQGQELSAHGPPEYPARCTLPRIAQRGRLMGRIHRVDISHRSCHHGGLGSRFVASMIRTTKGRQCVLSL